MFLAWSLVSNFCNVYTSRLRLRANGRNNSRQCWELLRARNVGRTVQTDLTLLRYASAITEQKKCWELLAEKFDRFLNFAQQHPTTCNRVYKRTQHVTSNSVGSCWPTIFCSFARGLTHSVNLRRLQRSNTNLWSVLAEFYRDCIFFDGLGICWTMLFTARNIFNTSDRC